MKTKIALCLFIACFAFVRGDDLPLPPYPKAALQAHEGGTVGMKVNYDDHGAVKSVDIISTSGVALLDTTAKNFVLSHWQNPSKANQTINSTMTFDPSSEALSVANYGPPPPLPDPNTLTATLPRLAKPKDTPLSLYKKHIRAVLDYYWAYEVKKHASDLEAGTVKLTYVIHSDGSISDITVAEGNNLEVLKQVGEEVLVAGTPYRPFTPEVIEEVGDKYTDTKSFTISR